MSRISLSTSFIATLPALVLVAACGSSTPTSSAATSGSSPAPSTSASAAAPGLAAALTAADIVNSNGFTQKSDSLLGGLANTDARVFTNAGGSTLVEVDLVSDTGASTAATDYPPYQSAAAKQVPKQASKSTPGLGQQSNEYAGTTAAGKNVVSIAFIEGKYIAVVTAVTGTLTPDVLKTTAESIAKTQDQKINSIGS